MKKADVTIGSTYIVKVSGKLTKVRITRESPYGGWDGLNLATHREVRIRSAARLRAPVEWPYRPPQIDASTPRLNPRERGVNLAVLRAWRQDRANRNEPSGVRDFFIAFGLCPECHSSGRGPYDDCTACRGTGLHKC
ncbi:MAG: hypothetical protein FJW34_11915 [Acidobacteria bacterium]|nr:hypothetical protein [Acidobacteriota bacterium]